MATSRTSSSHGAQNNVSGIISNGATWYETVVMTDQNGDPLTGVDADTWQFQFRCNPDSQSPDLTLTTADGTLTITESTTTTMLINVPQASLANMVGDYTADLVSKAASDGRLTHRAHGLVTFRNDPVAF